MPALILNHTNLASRMTESARRFDVDFAATCVALGVDQSDDQARMLREAIYAAAQRSVRGVDEVMAAVRDRAAGRSIGEMIDLVNRG